MSLRVLSGCLSWIICVFVCVYPCSSDMWVRPRRLMSLKVFFNPSLLFYAALLITYLPTCICISFSQLCLSKPFTQWKKDMCNTLFAADTNIWCFPTYINQYYIIRQTHARRELLCAQCHIYQITQNFSLFEVLCEFWLCEQLDFVMKIL